MNSSTGEDSDSKSPKDAMQTDSTVESITKEESSNITHLFKNLTQSKASSTDKSEKRNNPEVIFAASSKYYQIAMIEDCINAKRIENQDDAWR